MICKCGHSMKLKKQYGDGYFEPREQFYVCQHCGRTLWVDYNSQSWSDDIDTEDLIKDIVKTVNKEIESNITVKFYRNKKFKNVVEFRLNDELDNNYTESIEGFDLSNLKEDLIEWAVE